MLRKIIVPLQSKFFTSKPPIEWVTHIIGLLPTPALSNLHNSSFVLSSKDDLELSSGHDAAQLDNDVS